MTISVPLTQKQTLILDEADAGLVALGWRATKDGKTYYAVRNIYKADGTRTTEKLHRVIGARMGIEGEVDHKDRNGLNCTRENLRPATTSQNGANRGLRSDNTSGVKGISRYKRNGKWRAQIAVDNKVRHVGYFDDLESAKIAVKAAREAAFGEFACHG